jgi:PAS domain S-box-containing protein
MPEARDILIAEKERMEQALRESRERLEAALDASGAGTFRWDIRNNSVVCDEHWERLFGQRGSRVSLEQFISLAHPDDSGSVSAAVERSAREGVDLDLELRTILPGGDVRWILAKGKVHFDEQGTPAYMVGTCIDITKLKRTEEALSESAGRERAHAMEVAAIMNALPVVTFIAEDAECRIITGSRATHELLGVPEGENLAKFLPDGKRPTRFRATKGGGEIPADELPLHKAARTGQPVWNYELDIVYENGESRTLLGSTVPLKEENQDAARGAVGAFIDITDLKRMQNALRKSNEDLQRFASIVSHDLQSPLRTVSMMTQLLELHYKGSIDKEAAEFFSFIKSGSARMSRLISDLLDYSRVSREESDLMAVDAAALANSAVADLQVQIQESGSVVTIDQGLPRVIADAHLARVFQNLIGNAIKYRGEKPPEIRVSAERHGDQSVFAVRDNGIGFEMMHCEEIFGAFQRLPHAKRQEGSGLGLAICKNIVERYGGRIWAQSEPGKGSTFYFTVPVWE